MIFFDTAYVAKCYLNEPDAALVRALAAKHQTRFVADWTRTELACVLHRHFREGRLSRAQITALSSMFDADLEAGVWRVVPISTVTIDAAREAVRAAPKDLFIRAGDAIQLVSARQAGASEIWSNDRHLLAAASHFALEGRSI